MEPDSTTENLDPNTMDWNEVGVSDDILVSTAAFNAVDYYKKALSNLRAYADRRSLVESMMDDFEALDKHQAAAKRPDDKGSMVAMTKAEAAVLCDQIEDIVSISTEMPAKFKKRMSRHALAAINRLDKSAKLLRMGICSVEVTNTASVDDNSIEGVDAMEAAIDEMLAAMEWVKTRRRTWSKEWLKRHDPKTLARLRFMAIQRRDILEATKAKVEAGEIAPEQGAAILRGLRLVKPAEESAVLNGDDTEKTEDAVAEA